ADLLVAQFHPQERHGFRQPANRAHALLAEWRFYLGLLED
ncbi:hypothetical protein K3Z87_25735, partial [Pseudomonas aeruginosa]|nr:hypothetical protein [Pseudomonas aeruginosa]